MLGCCWHDLHDGCLRRVQLKPLLPTLVAITITMRHGRAWAPRRAKGIELPWIVQLFAGAEDEFRQMFDRVLIDFAVDAHAAAAHMFLHSFARGPVNFVPAAVSCISFIKSS